VIQVFGANGELLCGWAVDDIPVDGETSQPISSNWAYDHVAAADPHTGYVLESLFDAYTMLMATADNTPVALTVGAQTLVGRKTGGAIAALAGADALLAMGITPLVAELNYVDGVTSAIQTQLDGKQPLDATLTSIALLGTAADKMAYTTAIDTWAEAAITAAGRSMVGAANAAAQLALMTTALKAELDLLDLAGLTAGQLLVATAATTAAWQSTGVKLSAPDISGVVTAASALTLPAHILGGTLTLNGQVFDAGAVDAVIATTGPDKGLHIKSIQDSAEPVSIKMETISASPANSDFVGRIAWWGRNSTPAAIAYAYQNVQITNVTAASETAKYAWNLRNSGAWNEAMTLSGAGALWSDLSMDTLTYKVSGTQVVSARGAAVADATDAASVILRLNELLARVRTHGLIAT